MMEAHVRDDVEIVIFTDRTSMWHMPLTTSFVTKLEEAPPGITTRKERMRNIRFFELHRKTDVSGVSGEGVVAEGAMFSDGTCGMRWLTEWPTSIPYDSPEHIVHIHGHGDHTKLRWLKADGTYEEDS
jgi:hypothetical protein